MRRLTLWPIISVLALTACASAPPKPKHDRALKPTASSHASLTSYLDAITKGGKLGSNWCAGQTLFQTEFFAPTKYEILGAPSNDSFYSDRSGAYWTNYTVRLWSSNKGGSPVVKDWGISLKWSEQQYAQPGTLSWCIDYVSDKAS